MQTLKNIFMLSRKFRGRPVLVNSKYTSESVVGIFPICTYDGFILWQSFRFTAIILSVIWIIIQWRIEWRTDRKWCICAQRAICTGWLKNYIRRVAEKKIHPRGLQFNPQFFFYIFPVKTCLKKCNLTLTWAHLLFLDQNIQVLTLGLRSYPDRTGV